MNQPVTGQEPELFACIYCEHETPNGSPCPACGWPRCAECQRCIDHGALADGGAGARAWIGLLDRRAHEAAMAERKKIAAELEREAGRLKPGLATGHLSLSRLRRCEARQ